MRDKDCIRDQCCIIIISIVICLIVAFSGAYFKYIHLKRFFPEVTYLDVFMIGDSYVIPCENPHVD